MPHTKQTAKRVKTNEVRRQRNVARRSELRHAIRDLRGAIAAASGPSDELNNQLGGVCALVDRMASKGLIHSNHAARLKSRLTKRMPA